MGEAAVEGRSPWPPGRDRTGLSVPEVLTFWSNLPTHGTGSLYRQLFLNPLVIQPPDPDFNLNEAGTELATTTNSLAEKTPALLAALRVRSADLTALLAAVGDGSAFARGRDLAAWLGLTPRQHSTGGKTKMLGISKRGNKYLRKLLVHGARSAMRSLAASPTPLGNWLRGLLGRVHKNTATVALANKLARIVWAVLRHGRTFNPASVKAA